MRPILRGLAVSAGFVGAYILLVGALTCFNVVLLGHLDGKFANAPWQAWLEIYWPLWSIFYAPAAVTALLAAWYSGLSLRHTAALLGAFLVLILLVVETTWLTFAVRPHAERFGQEMLLGELVFLTGAFFVAASVCRRTAPRHQTSLP
jgi:hypothetical protein